jgi:hypothetical protein
MSSRHGVPVRGLMSTGRSPSFEGRFGRMFRSLSGATFGKDEDENLLALADDHGLAVSWPNKEIAWALLHQVTYCEVVVIEPKGASANIRLGRQK